MGAISMVIAAAKNRVKSPSATHTPPTVSRMSSTIASGSAGVKQRLAITFRAVHSRPCWIFGQP